MTHTVHVIEIINAPVEKIWEYLRDFNGLPSFHPAINGSRIERGDGESIGSIRYLTLGSGGYVREKLLTLDDENYILSYEIIDGSLPVENYKASVRLTFDEFHDQTKCEWWADFDVINGADKKFMIDLVGQQVFKAGFQYLSALCCRENAIALS